MALSLYDPWATLAAIAAKKWETRSWSTTYRGPIAIHATKIMAFEHLLMCRESPFREALQAAGYGYDTIGEWPRGAIIAVGHLVECVPTQDVVPLLTSRERAFGDYSPRRFAWRFEEMRRLATPIPVRGRQGLWNCTEVLSPRTGAHDHA